MFRKAPHTPLCIRFRRWSRKRYALFCSVGHCVTIGQLAKNITECSLQKSHSSSCILEHDFSFISDISESPQEDELSKEEFCPLELSAPFLSLIPVTAPADCCELTDSIYPNRMRITSRSACGFFICMYD